MGNSFGKGSYLTSSYVKKTIYLEDNNSVDLIIWDTCGKLEYSSLNEIFYKNSKVVIFVFDFTNKKSFDDIKNYWYEEIKKYTKPDTIFVLLGNYIDLCDKQEVDDYEAKEFAESIKAIFSVTFKGDHICMNYLLEKIARKIIEKLWKNKLEKYINF